MKFVFLNVSRLGFRLLREKLIHLLIDVALRGCLYTGLFMADEVLDVDMPARFFYRLITVRQMACFRDSTVIGEQGKNMLLLLLLLTELK